MKVASVDNKNSIRDDTLTVEDSNAQKSQIDISRNTTTAVSPHIVKLDGSLQNGNNSYIDDVHQSK